MITCICAIIKDEQDYLQEWIDWHLNLGFDHIYLYEDFDSTSHKEITDKYSQVTLGSVQESGVTPEMKKESRQFSVIQNKLYEWFYKTYQTQYDWCAFIDIDEFINLDSEFTLDSFLKEFNNDQGVWLFWKVKNANSNIKKQQKKVTETFTKDCDIAFLTRLGCKCKMILNFKFPPPTFKSAHMIDTPIVNTMHLKNYLVLCYRKAWIDHYFTKSWEEWCNRFKRGDLVENNRKIEQFFLFNPEMEYMKDELLEQYKNNVK